MYISPWPGLTAREFLARPSDRMLPYPLSHAHRLSFHVARSGIYHLFMALRLEPKDVVLVPDYHSGNEVSAILAANARIVYYPIMQNLEPDLDQMARLVRLHRPRVIYVIHYLGWPQPLKDIQNLCGESGSILVEDCALALLSDLDGKSLGEFGDYSIFCLYKTLPVPNGGLLVQNRSLLPALSGLKLDRCPRIAAAGRVAELALEAVRSRRDRVGKILFSAKQAVGRMLRSRGVGQVLVGDIGWNLSNVRFAMSAISDKVLAGLNYAEIRRKRRANFLRLQSLLDGAATVLRPDLAEGVCPLFFPILVDDKRSAARALWNRGISAVEFWNDEHAQASMYGGPAARFLRAHVLELPIHQDVTSEQIDYLADQLLRLRLKPALC
jgi:dTDP-4-amino-4,6-dideoxygalactose transaminase